MLPCCFELLIWAQEEHKNTGLFFGLSVRRDWTDPYLHSQQCQGGWGEEPQL